MNGFDKNSEVDIKNSPENLDVVSDEKQNWQRTYKKVNLVEQNYVVSWKAEHEDEQETEAVSKKLIETVNETAV